MRPVRLGLLVLGKYSFPRILELAHCCEAAGLDAFWIPDERFFRDTYVLGTAVAAATQRLLIGPCVTDPYSRHPAMTAATIATLDEVSSGRARLAIGAGIAGFRAMRLAQPRPAQTVAEATDLIRRLLRGERCQFRGEVVDFDGTLDFVPGRSNVPIYIAAGGPRMLETAGRFGDGVILQGHVIPAEIERALAHLRTAAEAAGRDIGTLELVARVDVAVDPSLDRAYDALRNRIARILVRESPHFRRFRKLGLGVSRQLVELTEGVGYTHDSRVLDRIAAHVPNEFVDAFCIPATPQSLGRRIDALLEHGFTEIVANPIPIQADHVEPVVDALGAWRSTAPPAASRLGDNARTNFPRTTP